MLSKCLRLRLLNHKKLHSVTRMVSLLTGTNIDKALSHVTERGWELVNNDGRDTIYQEYVFGDFRESWAFMCEIAIVAEEMNHYPFEWSNKYDQVNITLSTYVGKNIGISDKDVILADAIQEFFYISYRLNK